MPATSPKSEHAAKPKRCAHLRADGKRCADALYPGHATLCHHHLSQQMRGIPDGNSIAADILSSVGNFQSASAINVALGKLFIHQITGRISRQDALALAYTCQLLLQTLKMVKSELHECGYDQWWREETSRILSGPSDLDEITNQALLPTAAKPLHPDPLVDNSAPSAPPASAPTSSAGAATTRSAAPLTTPIPPPRPSSCSAGLQPSSASPSSNPSPAKPPQNPPAAQPSPSAPAAAPPNSASAPPPVATPPPRPAAPTPPLPAEPTAAPHTRPSAEVRCASRDAFPG